MPILQPFHSRYRYKKTAGFKRGWRIARLKHVRAEAHTTCRRETTPSAQQKAKAEAPRAPGERERGSSTRDGDSRERGSRGRDEIYTRVPRGTWNTRI